LAQKTVQSSKKNEKRRLQGGPKKMSQFSENNLLGVFRDFKKNFTYRWNRMDVLYTLEARNIHHDHFHKSQDDQT
jgi:hypothetical protein